jgi:hypothetical protein
MSIAPTHEAAAAAPSAPEPVARVVPSAPAAGAPVPRDRVELSGAVPAAPPEHVREEVARAAEVADELRREGRELRFRADEASGRVVIEVRALDGTVIREIPPSEALAVAAREARA